MKGHELQEIRRAFGLTQVQFAEKLGVHALTLSRFERDADPISRLVELAVRGLQHDLAATPKKKRKKK